jgi:hypothetical protein
VPNDIKIAKIIPLYKSGDKNKINNYRPISILPYFSKYFEKIMYRRIFDYFTRKNLLSKNQYGFRAGHSTFMALLEMQNKISEAIDNNMFSLGIFFDLSKAFDTVDHSILLKKLEHYGIRGINLAWFSSYLENRMQCVSYHSHLSPKMIIQCGVPQGSILGPLLFLIYINDICNTSKLLNFIIFADDTNVFIADKSFSNLINIANRELESVSLWFKVNKLSLNLDKTNFILFRSHRKSSPGEIKVCIDNKALPMVNSTKFLGVYIDQHLTWKEHISQVSKKISKSIGIISRVRYLLPKNILLNLYYSMVYPYLSYCNLPWASNYSSRLKCLETLQKRAIRIVCGLPFGSSTRSAFNRLCILSLEQINKYQISIFMYRSKNGTLPSAFDEYFCYPSHDHNTRSSKKLQKAFARTDTRLFSI